jgi:hypothetical protein
MQSRQLTIVGLAIVAGACSGTGAKTAWQGTVTDSAGVAIVQNPTTGLWDAADAWTVTEQLRVGAAEGEPEYQFGMVVGMAVAKDGRIAVLDQQGRHVKLFGADGKYLTTIGKPGGGPGELGPGVTFVMIDPADTLFVADLQNQRVNLYLLDGTSVRSFRVALEDGIPFRWEGTADGRIVTQVRRMTFPGSTAPPDTMDAILVRKSDGTVADTLMRVPSGKTFSFAGGAPEFNFFTAEPQWALFGDKLLYGVNDEFRIGVYGPGGGLERVVSKPFERAPVGQADQDAIVATLERLWKDAGVPQQAVAQLKTAIHFAPNYPAYAQMLAGPEGSFWVQRLQSLADLSAEERADFNPLFDLGSPAWDVFDGEGRYLGVVTMPRRFQPMRFVEDKIYGIQRDELDVQYIVRLGVVKGSPAS